MNSLDLVARDFLAECRDDYVGLWSVVKRVRQAMPQQSPLELRQATLRLLTKLLEHANIVVGSLGAIEGFQAWPLSPTEAIGKIESEWSNLDHEPDIGDIAWFTEMK